MGKTIVVAVMSVLLAGAVCAQTAPPAVPPPTMPEKKARTPAQTPEGIECSKQADAKGLHGQDRIRFRANCKLRLAKQKKS